MISSVRFWTLAFSLRTKESAVAGLLVANFFYWRRVALLALGRADYPAKVNLVLASFKLAGTFTLVPKFGYLASAALLSAFYWLSSLLTVWKVRLLIASRETPIGAQAGTDQ